MESVKKYAITAAIVAGVMYAISNFTSTTTAKSFGLAYQGKPS